MFNSNLECLFVEMTKGHDDNSGQHIIVGVIFRPYDTDVSVFNNAVNFILDKLKPESKSVYISVDYNITLLNIDKHSLTPEFLDIMFSYSFFPLINRPTRVRAESATLIDNIYCNVLKRNIFSGIFYTEISDHFLFPVLIMITSLLTKLII